MKPAAREQLPFGTFLSVAACVVLCLLFTGGCSPKPPPSAATTDSGGLHIALTTDPSPLRAGNDTLIITITDTKTSMPVVNANVTVSAYNKLAGGGESQTGRSQGNGVYNVPINLPISDTYTAYLTVQRIGHPDVTAQFPLVAG